jgi:hypothetical protein
MQCSDCRFYNGEHDKSCPTLHPEFRGRFAAGWSAGRAGVPLDRSYHPAYILGWTLGDAAADEAENSVSWSS